jgi:hypothetical protein
MFSCANHAPCPRVVMAETDRDPPGPVASDHLDDLRVQLPAAFRDAPDGQIAQLCVAWEPARHDHPADYLTDTCAVAPEVAEQLIALARQHEHHGEC